MASRPPQETSWQRMQQNVPQALQANADSTARAKNPSGRAYIADFHNIEISLRSLRETVSGDITDKHRAVMAMVKEHKTEAIAIAKERKKVYELFDRNTALENEIVAHRPPQGSMPPHAAPQHQPATKNRSMAAAEVKEKRNRSRKHSSIEADDEISHNPKGFVSRLVDKVGAETLGIATGIVVGAVLPGLLSKTNNGKPPDGADILGALNPISSAKADTLDPSKLPPRSSTAGNPAASREVREAIDKSLPIFDNANQANDEHFSALSNRAINRVDSLIRAYENIYKKKRKEADDAARLDLAKNTSGSTPGINGLTPNGRTATYDPKTNTTTITSPGGSQVVLPGDVRSMVVSSSPTTSQTGGAGGVYHSRPGKVGGNVNTYKVGPASRGISGKPNKSMNTRAMRLMNRLIKVHGWTPEAAAIAAGNAQQEHGIKPDDGHLGDVSTGNPAHGMFQWRMDRYEALQRFKKAHPELDAFDAEVDFFANEAEHRKGTKSWKTFHDLASQGGLQEAGRLGKSYEVYGDNSTGTRVNNALNWLQVYNNGGSKLGIEDYGSQPAEAKAPTTTPETSVSANTTPSADMLAAYGQGNNIPALAASPHRNPDIADVDPRLREIVAAGATHLPPGYTVTVNAGYTAYGHAQFSQHHIKGRGALDVVIRDPNGNVLVNEGRDPTGLYHMLARSSYGEMLARYPDLKGQFAWGGAFGTVTGGNVSDTMHFDFGGERGHITQNLLSRMGPLPPEQFGKLPNGDATAVVPLQQRSLGAFINSQKAVSKDEEAATTPAPQPTPPPAVDASSPQPPQTSPVFRKPDVDSSAIDFYKGPEPTPPPVKPDPEPAPAPKQSVSKGNSAPDDNDKPAKRSEFTPSGPQHISSNMEDINLPNYSTGVA